MWFHPSVARDNTRHHGRLICPCLRPRARCHLPHVSVVLWRRQGLRSETLGYPHERHSFQADILCDIGSGTFSTEAAQCEGLWVWRVRRSSGPHKLLQWFPRSEDAVPVAMAGPKWEGIVFALILVRGKRLASSLAACLKLLGESWKLTSILNRQLSYIVLWTF